ncbi:DUF3006 family protein [Haloterrigena alkaliphila]|uniref:DUF3006 family protein n=1 Tax=Haloterrigena alkaliphila TaxID=2816475 RepID=A0A8A2VGE1_9EURY|nr:DUF3006 family protein [Haloterrigena alkaliphila]QSW99727.1 DUF3006 domain-containing protein [Haloterrigena alkaliphila]
MTETYTAVLDRIVDGETAVLLLEVDGAVVDERVLDVDRLPEDGRHEGAVFDLELEDEGEDGDEEGDAKESDPIRELTYRPSAERERRDDAQDRFDRLSERLPDE